MPDKKPPVIVPVDSSTGQAYEDFEAMLSKEGTKALREKWSTLTHQLRKHLQIEYSPVSSSPGETKPLKGVGDGSGLPSRRKP